MGVYDFLKYLGYEPKQQGNNWLVTCPECDDHSTHLSMQKHNGVGRCLRCDWRVNPYKLAAQITGKEGREVFEILDRYGINDKESRQPEPPKEEKKLALSREDFRILTDEEKQQFCRMKQIETDCFGRLGAWGHKTEPWVLIPAFSPTEPGKACGWMRCGIHGQLIRLAGGREEKYPLVAGSRHGLLGVPWLIKENPDTIVFCEAWRDMLAVLSIGLAATASSGGASTFQEEWLSFFEGKKVFICMDADTAGQRAAERAAKALFETAKEVWIVNLPYEVTDSHGKDAHDYIVGEGKGKEFLLLMSRARRYLPTSEQRGRLLLRNSNAMTIAEELYEQIAAEGIPVRHYNYQGKWCRYTGAVWEIVDEIDMRNRVWRFARECDVPGKGEDSPPKELNCTDNVVKNTHSAMASFDGVEIESGIITPAWLVDEQDRPDPKYVLALQNGLLDVSGAEPVLGEHTEQYLNFNLLTFAYEPKAGCPQWLTFLGQVFRKEQLSAEKTQWDQEREDFDEVAEDVPDEDKIQSLQEWFGLLLTSEMKYHKILGIIGTKRSGKGTIGRVLTELIGRENVATPTFASMTESFGLQSMLNAKAAIFGDANMDKDPVVVGRAVEKLKSISGEDGIDVNRKYEKYLPAARLHVRFVLISNNLQRLTDPTGTISDRFIFLRTTQSFYGREDLGLEGRLIAELPGILNWALEGLRRLTEREYLSEPAESVEMRTQSKELGSNVIAFVNQGCRTGEGLYTTPDVMYEAFKRWCEQDGSQPMKKRAFRQEFNEAFGEHACSKHRIGREDNPVWVYWEIEPLAAFMYGNL